MTAIDAHLPETLLRSAAEHSLRAFLEPNAIFLAERLHQIYPSDSSANLLATAHLRQGNFSRAADILRHTTSSENRYLSAVCLSRIGSPEALRDAEAYLRGAHGPIDVALPPPVNHAAATPGGAAGLYLLGCICHRTGRKDEAITLFRRAVKVNPTLWVAFEALAGMGIVSKAEQVLGTSSDATALERLEAQPQFFSYHAEASSPRRRHRSTMASHGDTRPAGTPTARSQGAQTLANGPQGAAMSSLNALRTPASYSGVHANSYATPSPMPSNRGGAAFGDMTTPTAPQQLVGRNGVGRRLPRHAASPLSSHLRHGNRRSISALEDSHVRNPNDLFATPTESTPLAAREDACVDMQGQLPSAQVMDPKAPMAGTPTPHVRSKHRVSFRSKSVPMETSESDRESETMDLIRMLGQIVSELGRFRCARTLELTERLPVVHRNSGLVLSIRGRAYLEKGDYGAAEREFLRSLEVEPMRMDGVVEYYSTVLWHLKKGKELAQLAIRAQRVYPVSASAWCAAGNCFALQKDPDTALRFFQRAISSSRTPNAYAYTLAGHEHVVKENFEAAMAAYRQALHIDERHYNAMYGIGMVLQKQEKFALAQSHFRSAVLIHPLNATLHYHLGTALAAAVNASSGSERLSRGSRNALVPALAEFETAANLDPKNPVPRFERAKLLVAINRLPEARRQLEGLRDALPKEAEVHFELSRVCKRMGDPKSALRALSTALDIEPKERKYKKALEGLSGELAIVGSR